jgi:methylglyoxal synthase
MRLEGFGVEGAAGRFGQQLAGGEQRALAVHVRPQAHDIDVKAPMLLWTLYNIPMANNRATADFSLPLFTSAYQPASIDLQGYFDRLVAP